MARRRRKLTVDDPVPQGVGFGDAHPRPEELVRRGGPVKHQMMNARLEAAQAQGLTTEELREGTQHCPHCQMHVAKSEAMCCLACSPLPDHAEVGSLLSPSGTQAGGLTLYTPDWWVLADAPAPVHTANGRSA